MPDVKRPNKATIYAEVAPRTKKALQAAAKKSGRTVTQELELAITRHCLYPPMPQEVAPLPDAAENNSEKSSNLP